MRKVLGLQVLKDTKYLSVRTRCGALTPACTARCVGPSLPVSHWSLHGGGFSTFVDTAIRLVNQWQSIWKMRTVQVLICLWLLISIGNTLRVPLPEFLEKFFDDNDSETERQTTAVATSSEAIFAAFVGTFLYSLVRNLLVLDDEQAPNTAAAACSISRTIASDNGSKS